MYAIGVKARRAVLLSVPVALMTVSCASNDTPPVARDRLLFRPTSTFDEALSESLRASLPEVRVRFAAGERIDEPPQRLDNWFAAVERSGGQIQRAERVAGVGFVGIALALLPIVLPRLQERLQERLDEVARSRMYATAAGYDIQLHLAEDNVTIREAVFVRR